MTVRLIIGDCMQHLSMMPADGFDCAIVDPPYGETSLRWDRRVSGWPAAVRRVVKRTGSMWVFGSLRHLIETRDEFAGWRMSHEIVWEKHNGTGLFNDRFRRVHEIAAHFYRDDCPWEEVYKAPQFTNDATARTVRKKGRPAQWIGATGETVYRSEDGGPRLMRSVIYQRSEHGQGIGHPTPKPVALILPLLAYACPPGGTVLDPFAGSGSVGIAAKQSGRRATLIEINADYVEIARRRVANDAPLLDAAS